MRIHRLLPVVLLIGLAWLIVAAQSDPREVPPGLDAVRYDGDVVIRAYIQSDEDIDAMRKIARDVWSHGEGHGHVDYLLSRDDLVELDARGIRYVVFIENVQDLIDAQMERADAQGGFFSQYRNLAEINAFVDGLVTQRPDLASVSTFGQSIENRDLRVLTITGPGGGNKPQVVYNFLQHAREWITGAAGCFLADHLVQNYGVDPEITALLDAVEFHIVNVLNPDGYEYSWGPNRLWRKNRRNNGGGDFGVDLNRNWDAGWGGVGSSGDPGSDTYRGTAAFSEPETAGLRDYMRTLPRIQGHIDVHSYSQLVLHPYGYTSSLPPDHPALDELGGLINDAMQNLYGKTYIHGPIWTTIYPASGGAEDWSYDEFTGTAATPVMYSYGFELRDEGQFGFLLPADQIVPASEECLAGILTHARWASTLLGFEFPNGLPSQIDPVNPGTLTVQVVPRAGASYQEGTGRMMWRVAGGLGFAPIDFSSMGGGMYEVALPTGVSCGSTLEFYFEAQTTSGEMQRSPFGAPASSYDAEVIAIAVAFEDNFQLNQGWTVQNENLTDGPWQRGVPANGDRGDPPADFDGSGSCYVTDNVAGNSDVDGGPTRLSSPTLDLSGGDDAIVEYAYWVYCDDGDDTLVVEISNNGGSTWSTARTYTGGGGGWNTDSFTVSDFVTPTANVRVRFSVADQPNDSVTEAAIDAFRAVTTECPPVESFEFTQTPLVRGQSATFTATGAEPGTDVYFYYSRNGEGAGPCDPFFGGLCFDIVGPVKRFARATANASGVAERTKTVPPNAPLITFHTQAINRRGTNGDQSVKSNVIEATAQP